MTANVRSHSPPRGVIYTAITGGKDELREPAFLTPNVDHICFTDNPKLKSDVWDIRPIKYRHTDPVRVAKHPKLLPHLYLREYDWSLWIDGNFEIKDELTEFIERHISLAAFSAFRQFQRSCVYDEVQACIDMGKDNPALLRAQGEKYRKFRMPEGLPVVACLVMLRWHNDPDVIKTMQLWWEEVEGNSRRDQLSLPYILWKHPADFRFFFDGERPYWNELPFLERRPHVVGDRSKRGLLRILNFRF